MSHLQKLKKEMDAMGKVVLTHHGVRYHPQLAKGLAETSSTLCSLPFTLSTTSSLCPAPLLAFTPSPVIAFAVETVAPTALRLEQAGAHPDVDRGVVRVVLREPRRRRAHAHQRKHDCRREPK